MGGTACPAGAGYRGRFTRTDMEMVRPKCCRAILCQESASVPQHGTPARNDVYGSRPGRVPPASAVSGVRKTRTKGVRPLKKGCVMAFGWSTKRVLIVVKTYPTPAHKGVEVSCTAG